MFNVKRLTDFIVTWHGIKSEGYQITREVVKELRRLERLNKRLVVELHHMRQVIEVADRQKGRER